MTAEYPVGSTLLWLRWSLAATAIVLLPGWLLVGRGLRGRLAVPRLAFAAGVGIVFAVVWCITASAVGLRIDPFLFLLTALPITWGIGRLRPLQSAVDRSIALQPATGVSAWPGWGQDLTMSIGSIALAWILADGFRQLCAPPHLHDASNHAFMVSRIVQVHTMRQDAVFGAPYCGYGVPYFLGWHAVIAMVAELSGVAPYIATWFWAIACCVLIPAALCLLWIEAGVPTFAAALAACFVAANHYVPAGLFSWGGFGAAAGMFLLPTLAVLLRGAVRNGSLVLGAAAGVCGGAMVFVHFSEVVTAVLIVAVFTTTSGGQRAPARRLFLVIAVAALAFLGIGGRALLEGLQPYLQPNVQVKAAGAEPLGLVLAQTLMYSSSVKTSIQVLALAGVGWGLWERRTRRVALMALGVAAACISLRTIHDPVSAFFAQAYYGQPARVLYLQMYLMPVLLAWPMARIRMWTQAGWQRWASAALLGALFAWMIFPSMVHNRDNVRNRRTAVPFEADEYRLALRVRELVPEDAVVANQPDDGSFWAMHVSGRRFLDPTAWALGCFRGDVPLLLAAPWPPQALALRDLGVRYVYASDRLLPGAPPLVLPRSRLEADGRFEELLHGESASLYRIRWTE